MQTDMSLDIYSPSTTVILPVDNTHPTLEFLFHDELNTPTIQDCAPCTPASTIERWRSRFRHGTIRAINGAIIDTIPQLKLIIQEILKIEATMCSINITHEDFGNLHSTAQGLPQMHLDQLKAVAHHLNCIKYGDDYNLHIRIKTNYPQSPCRWHSPSHTDTKNSQATERLGHMGQVRMETIELL